jgi:hypothetical protein
VSSAFRQCQPKLKSHKPRIMCRSMTPPGSTSSPYDVLRPVKVILHALVGIEIELAKDDLLEIDLCDKWCNLEEKQLIRWWRWVLWAVCNVLSNAGT